MKKTLFLFLFVSIWLNGAENTTSSKTNIATTAVTAKSDVQTPGEVDDLFLLIDDAHIDENVTDDGVDNVRCFSSAQPQPYWKQWSQRTLITAFIYYLQCRQWLAKQYRTVWKQLNKYTQSLKNMVRRIV